MLVSRKMLLFGMGFPGAMAIYLSYDLKERLDRWGPSVGVLIITLIGIIFILPFIVFHWQHWDFIIWDWKRDAPSFYYHINHDFSWLKYLAFGPVLAAALAPLLRATPQNFHDAFMFVLETWLIGILGYMSIGFTRGLLNVHKR